MLEQLAGTTGELWILIDGSVLMDAGTIGRDSPCDNDAFGSCSSDTSFDTSRACRHCRQPAKVR